MLIKKEKTLAIAASKSGMDEKTARKYLKAGILPSQLKKPHDWRTLKWPPLSRQKSTKNKVDRFL